MHRVFVTGIGAVTPLGGTFEETWQALREGLSGIVILDDPEFQGLRCRLGGRVRNFSPGQWLARKQVRRTDRFVQLAVAAAAMALRDAGLPSDARSTRFQNIGVIVGSSRGGVESLSRAGSGQGRTSPFLMASSTPYMATGAISMQFGFQGPTLGVSTACASGLHAIGEAVRWIRYGIVDRVLAGGAEAPLCRLAVGGYDAAGALSQRNDDPEGASRPFCIGRDGFVLSEGAALLMLESQEAARARKATVAGEIFGFGSTGMADHETRPAPGAALRAMDQALRDAKAGPDELAWVSAHGTSTPLGDQMEADAIREIVGERTDPLPVSAIKSRSGHLLAASGALEVAVALRSVSAGRVPGSPSAGEPDSRCALRLCRETTPIDPNGLVICNAFGFGGAGAALVAGAPRDRG